MTSQLGMARNKRKQPLHVLYLSKLCKKPLVLPPQPVPCDFCPWYRVSLAPTPSLAHSALSAVTGSVMGNLYLQGAHDGVVPLPVPGPSIRSQRVSSLPLFHIHTWFQVSPEKEKGFTLVLPTLSPQRA